MKKVLIITYYWPPGGGAGVQRWLKFVKYLRNFGWEPVVYTPENGEMPVIDHSLLKDVPEGITIIKRPIWEPYQLYKKFIGQKKEEKINTGFLTEGKKPKLAEKVSVWLRGNFFIPDARKAWIKPSVEFLSSYLKQNPVDVLVSTGPPHSMHLIAMKLKEELNIPWLADFRDPWTRIDFYKELLLTPWADRKHHRLEKEVLSKADRVTAIGKQMLDEFVRMDNRGSSREKFVLITNGYDTEDTPDHSVLPDKKFSIAHIGSMARTRNPVTLWKVLSEKVRSDSGFATDLEIRLIGKVDVSVMESIQQAGLIPYVIKTEYLPHNEIVKIQQQSQVLLLVVNDTPNAKGIITGKIFEYLAARRPVLCIGPKDGEAAAIMQETNSGVIAEFSDRSSTAQAVETFYKAYKSGTLAVPGSNIEKYSRKNLTRELASVLTELCKEFTPNSAGVN